MIVECCICKNYKNKDTGKYYTPTLEERRHNYINGVKISHSYCLIDFVLMMRKDGASESEIEQMVKSAEEIK